MSKKTDSRWFTVDSLSYELLRIARECIELLEWHLPIVMVCQEVSLKRSRLAKAGTGKAIAVPLYWLVWDARVDTAAKNLASIVHDLVGKVDPKEWVARAPAPARGAHRAAP